MANHADWQLQIYQGGMTGTTPELPMSWAELERRAHDAMSEQIWSYVTGGAGSEHTQRANVAAFERWGLMPRVLRGAAERDVSVELFGTRYDTPLMRSPIVAR